MDPILLADLLVVLHLGIVAFVVGVALLIPIGGWLGWSWVRNRPLRLAHLLTVVIIVLQSLFGRLCFLTIWEAQLRRSAGQEPDDISFMARLVRKLLFVEGVPQELLDRAYYLFFALLLVGWLFVRPRPWRGRRRISSD